jgi:hypothetical protein
MEIHSIDGYGTDAYVYLQVNKKIFKDNDNSIRFIGC